MTMYEVICGQYVIKLQGDSYEVNIGGTLTISKESKPVATFSMGKWDSVWDESLRIQEDVNE